MKEDLPSLMTNYISHRSVRPCWRLRRTDHINYTVFTFNYRFAGLLNGVDTSCSFQQVGQSEIGPKILFRFAGLLNGVDTSCSFQQVGQSEIGPKILFHGNLE